MKADLTRFLVEMSLHQTLAVEDNMVSVSQSLGR